MFFSQVPLFLYPACEDKYHKDKLSVLDKTKPIKLSGQSQKVVNSVSKNINQSFFYLFFYYLVNQWINQCPSGSKQKFMFKKVLQWMNHDVKMAGMLCHQTVAHHHSVGDEQQAGCQIICLMQVIYYHPQNPTTNAALIS